ncbi:MAG: two-component sensor histidine kinase [Cyclobacteriaceae bacterium]|jgi:two-component sensor histidine kinase
MEIYVSQLLAQSIWMIIKELTSNSVKYENLKFDNVLQGVIELKFRRN